MTTVNIAQLKRDHPLAAVVQEHGVALRRQGGRLAGCCPFHEERRPSFVVYPDSDSFYCFGCGAGGDVISFVRRTTGLGFLDAVAHLAGEPPRASRTPTGQPEQRSIEERAVLTAACAVYHETLLRTPAALAYLRGRGIGLATVRRARLGYSDGGSLRPLLERQRLGVQRAIDLGLLWRRGGGEPLAGRIIVPELRGGECIWLVGRALAAAVEPRYWSISRPKPLLGYERVVGRQRVIVTEGPFDLLTAAGWGLSACALLGTHTRAERLDFLARARRVLLVFDADLAGRRAAAELAARLGERARIIELPAGVKDLNDLGRRPDGRTRFLRLLAEAERIGGDTEPADSTRTGPPPRCAGQCGPTDAATAEARPSPTTGVTGAVGTSDRSATSAACSSPLTVRRDDGTEPRVDHRAARHGDDAGGDRPHSACDDDGASGRTGATAPAWPRRGPA